MWSLIKFFKPCWFLKNIASSGWGMFSLYDSLEFFWKSSQKPLVHFQNNFTEVFMCWPFIKFLQVMLVCKNMLANCVWASFHSTTTWLVSYWKLRKSSHQKHLAEFQSYFTKIFLQWTLIINLSYMYVN